MADGLRGPLSGLSGPREVGGGQGRRGGFLVVEGGGGGGAGRTGGAKWRRRCGWARKTRQRGEVMAAEG